MQPKSYLSLRIEVEEIAAQETARGSTLEAGLGRAAVEYWFEDLTNNSVTPLPVKIAVAIAICDLKHHKTEKPDCSEEVEALVELAELVSQKDMLAVFSSGDLQHMEELSQRLLPQEVTSQLRFVFSSAARGKQ